MNCPFLFLLLGRTYSNDADSLIALTATTTTTTTSPRLSRMKQTNELIMLIRAAQSHCLQQHTRVSTTTSQRRRRCNISPGINGRHRLRIRLLFFVRSCEKEKDCLSPLLLPALFRSRSRRRSPSVVCPFPPFCIFAH